MGEAEGKRVSTMKFFAVFLLLQSANANSRCYKCTSDYLNSDCYKGHKMAEHQCNDENGCAVEVVSKYYHNGTVDSDVKRDCKSTIQAQVPINNLPDWSMDYSYHFCKDDYCNHHRAGAASIIASAILTVLVTVC